jgi:hypothetical protein
MYFLNERLTIEELKSICQKKEKDKNFYIAPISRRISIRITALLIRTPVTANQLSVACIVVGTIASFLLSLGVYIYGIVAGLLLGLFVIIDTVDGEVARYRRKITKSEEDKKGRFLELAEHMTIMPFIFISLSYGVFNRFNDSRAFTLGFSSVMFFMLYHVVAFYVAYVKRLDQPLFTPETKNLRVIKRFVFNLLSSSFLPIIILIFALFDGLYIALALYGLAFPILALLYMYLQFLNF